MRTGKVRGPQNLVHTKYSGFTVPVFVLSNLQQHNSQLVTVTPQLDSLATSFVVVVVVGCEERVTEYGNQRELSETQTTLRGNREKLPSRWMRIQREGSFSLFIDQWWPALFSHICGFICCMAVEENLQHLRQVAQKHFAQSRARAVRWYRPCGQPELGFEDIFSTNTGRTKTISTFRPEASSGRGKGWVLKRE